MIASALSGGLARSFSACARLAFELGAVGQLDREERLAGERGRFGAGEWRARLVPAPDRPALGSIGGLPHAANRQALARTMVAAGTTARTGTSNRRTDWGTR